MAVNLSPLGGAGWQFFDNSGVPSCDFYDWLATTLGGIVGVLLYCLF